MLHDFVPTQYGRALAFQFPSTASTEAGRENDKSV